MKDWKSIAIDLPEILWREGRDTGRKAAPALLLVLTIAVSYGIGKLDVSTWYTLVSFVFGGFAIGLAADRAEARAAKDWAAKFWKLIETDHVLEISVTHHNTTEGKP